MGFSVMRVFMSPNVVDLAARRRLVRVPLEFASASEMGAPVLTLWYHYTHIPL